MRPLNNYESYLLSQEKIDANMDKTIMNPIY